MAHTGRWVVCLQVSKTRAYIDADTGAMLTAVTYRSFEADARQGAERFPKVCIIFVRHIRRQACRTQQYLAGGDPACREGALG
jgi:hypothetical protein